MHQSRKVSPPWIPVLLLGALLAGILDSPSAPSDVILAVQAADEGECRVTESGERVCDAGSGGKGGECDDKHEYCEFWASKGECAANPNYMRANCARACNVCPKKASALKAKLVDPDSDPAYHMIAEFGEPQTVEGREGPDTLFVIRQTVSYMKNFVLSPKPTHTLSSDVIAKCINRHDKCAFWAAIGECENNPAWMATNCAPSCRTCHQIDFATRCPARDPNMQPGLKPGELNAMFERIVETAPGNRSDISEGEEAKLRESGTPAYTVTVHSRAAPIGDDKERAAVDPKRDGEEPPWVITFDNFLTQDECEHLIQLGYQYEYKRSKDVGKQNFDGSFNGRESTTRTSENAWCQDRTGCRADDVVQRVMDRLADVTGVPSTNYEDLQMLKYEEGQFYRVHHDYIPHQRQRQCGPRIMTFFLYLSDVEGGGGTAFPNLDPPLTIMPKRGRALLWPSILDSDPSSKDERMMHEALPVTGGTKFAANAWVHLYDYLSPQRTGCN